MFKQFVAKAIAARRKKSIDKWSLNPILTQQKVFKKLITSASKTKFGLDHNFNKIKNHKDYVKNIPIRDYEGFKSYIELIKNGEKNILWKGAPIYFAITSGTTSGTKYIPITKESLPEHLNASKNAIFLYINETGNTSFLSGKFIFLQGSPILGLEGVIKTGRLSGISAHHIPNYLQSNRLPSWETNCIEDWEKKVDKIIEETIDQDMTLIGGIPSWVQMYFEKITKLKNKKIGDVFKNLNLFKYIANNSKNQKKFTDLKGTMNGPQLYPASEGFFAFQNTQKSKDLLLLIMEYFMNLFRLMILTQTITRELPLKRL